jgi:hypothetical protein
MCKESDERVCEKCGDSLGKLGGNCNCCELDLCHDCAGNWNEGHPLIDGCCNECVNTTIEELLTKMRMNNYD